MPVAIIQNGDYRGKKKVGIGTIDTIQENRNMNEPSSLGCLLLRSRQIVRKERKYEELNQITIQYWCMERNELYPIF
jgi:hypothetical protein